MFSMIKPSAIQFTGDLAIYCYHCPVCGSRLSKQYLRSGIFKMPLYLLTLKRYKCSHCDHSYHVHADTYQIKQQIKYTLGLDESFQG
jgi:rubredoxin